MRNLSRLSCCLALFSHIDSTNPSDTAVVSGDIKEPKESSISSEEAKRLGVCIGEDSDSPDTSWQIIEDELEGQSAVTIWRTLRQFPLENARNNTASVVELKPKTGRYHQLRRHMVSAIESGAIQRQARVSFLIYTLTCNLALLLLQAWVHNCPLLGDKTYDGGGLAKNLRDRGFYLCSNRVTLEHPYYNTKQGRKEWEANKGELLGNVASGDYGRAILEEGDDGVVMVHCEIDLPTKFNEF